MACHVNRVKKNPGLAPFRAEWNDRNGTVWSVGRTGVSGVQGSQPGGREGPACNESDA